MLTKKKIKTYSYFAKHDTLKLLELTVRGELLTKYNNKRTTLFLIKEDLIVDFAIEFIKPLWEKYGDGLKNGSIDFNYFKNQVSKILKINMGHDLLGAFFEFSKTENPSKWYKANKEFYKFCKSNKK